MGFPSQSPADPAARSALWLVRVATLFYFVFVVYGSLVPLDYRAVELSAAVERFRQVPFLDLGVGSRADWVANLLLFIPLSYLMLASLRPRRPAGKIMLSILIVVACTVLSVAIEFTQIFFPPRTVSQNDIMAETVGGFIGVVAWWFSGERTFAWLIGWQRARGVSNLAEKLLALYLLLFFAYNLLPLDLTISVVEIYHKWNEGRLNLIPFGAMPSDPAQLVYGLVTDVLLWIPVSLLLILSGRAQPRRAVMLTVAGAGLLELLQVLVYTRVSDLTDVITAIPGAFAGAWLAERLRPGTLTAPSPSRSYLGQSGAIVLAIVGWCALLAAIFWYPFEFSRDKDLVRRGIDALFQVPFVAYYFGTEYRAVTEVFHKVGFFLPLGALLAWLRWTRGNHGPMGGWDTVVLLLLVVPPGVIELGQVALVDKYPGSTDLVLGWLGGVIGFVGLLAIARRWQDDDSIAPVSAGAAPVGSLKPRSPAGPALSPVPPVARVQRRPTPASSERIDLAPLAFLAPVWALLFVASRVVPLSGPQLLPAGMRQQAIDSPVALVWAIGAAALLFVLVRVRTIQLPHKRGGLTAGQWSAAAAVILVALLPTAPEVRLLDSLGGGFGRPDQRLYVLLKAVILWVPLGVIAVIAGAGAGLLRWVTAGAVSFFIIGLPLLWGLTVQDLYEVLAAPLGVGLGIWLSQRLLQEIPLIRSEAARPPAADAATAMQGPAKADQQTLYDIAFAEQPLTAGAPPPPVQADSPAANTQSSADETKPPEMPPMTATGARPLTIARVASLGLIAPVLISALAFPAVGPWLVLLLAFYYVLAVRYPGVVLIVVPWALPAFDLAPWTGRIFFDEFDLLLLASLAVAVWHWPGRVALLRAPRMLRITALLFGLSCIGGILIGLWPLPDLDHNAFSSYRSQWNALRIGKGFLWSAALVGLVIMLPVRRDWRMPVLIGISLGLVSVGLVTVWERALFAALWDFSIDYRVMATFSSMHVGGAHIEAYTVLALPLVAHFLRTARLPWQSALAAAALILGVYVLVSTVARGALLGLGAAVLIYAFGLWLQRTGAQRMSIRHGLIGGAVLSVAAVVLVLGVGGVYFQERLARSFDDLQGRLAHWRAATDVMDEGLATTFFGMGLGQFPQAYLVRADLSIPPGTYRFDGSDEHTHLALGAGETLYFTQRVAVQSGTRYRLTLRARANGGAAKLSTTLCERHLSHSRRCVWLAVTLPGDGRWHERSIDIETGTVGGSPFPFGPPVDFALYNPTGGSVIRVDDLRLTGPDGVEVLSNGSFEKGSDHWFIKTHEHLSWHIKNQWVATYFDQGLVGVVFFTGLALAVIGTLIRGVRAGSRLALAVLAGLAGFLAVGTVGSPFDAPRLILLFFGAAALGLRHLAEGWRHA